MIERKTKLRVISEEPRKQAQDCGACRLQSTCWMAGIKPEHIVTNMLVCRMKRDIERSRAAKLFLQMVRPKLKLLAKKAIYGTNIDMDVALADMESATIEYIMKNFILGERGYPLHYLFGERNGVMRHYASNYARKTRRWDETFVLHGDTIEEEAFDPYQDDEQSDVTTKAREVIDDGMTLNLAEYRTLKFCMTNASEAKRPLNGLHVYLSRAMGVVRARTTRIYSDACKKLKEAVQEE